MDSNLFRFREFPVYKEARNFRKDLKQLSRKKFPKEEDYVLRQQLWRALDSVILNIAEGSNKNSDREFSHFLSTALGSLNEVVGCLDCALDDSYLSQEEYQEYLRRAENLARQLKAFWSKVRKDNRRF